VSEPSAGARAVVDYEIEDVILIESTCKVDRDFNPMMLLSETAFAHRVSVDSEVLAQTKTPVSEGESFHLIRYFLTTEVRLVKPGKKPDEESPKEDDFMATLNFVFAIDYRCSKEATEDREAIGAFSSNAQFHAWPFIREEIHAMCGRLRIPRLTIPMLKPIPMRDGSGHRSALPSPKNKVLPDESNSEL
jgi:hypothetical protein